MAVLAMIWIDKMGWEYEFGQTFFEAIYPAPDTHFLSRKEKGYVKRFRDLSRVAKDVIAEEVKRDIRNVIGIKI